MADTLEIFGVEYTNVAGIIATDSNGNEGMQMESMTIEEWLKHIEGLLAE